MEKLKFETTQHKAVLNKSVKEASFAHYKKKRLSGNQFIRDAMREKCDRDGIDYKEYEE